MTLFRHTSLQLSLCEVALPIYSQLWHLRDPLERERWQKDGWPRYFRTQLLLFQQSANTGLHKDRGESRGVGWAKSGGRRGLWGRGGVGGLLAQLLIWYSRLVRKGDLGASDTHTHTYYTHNVERPLNPVSVSSGLHVKDLSAPGFGACAWCSDPLSMEGLGFD